MFTAFRATSLVTTLLLTAITTSSAHADLIDILAIHGVTNPDLTPDTVINSTDRTGTVDIGENTNRKVNNLLDEVGLSGPPFIQASVGTPTQAYYNSNFIDERGDVGILIDLGRIHRVDAMQLYGYNISDAPGFSDRTPENFTIWTATDDSAVRYEGMDEDLIMLVDNILMFTQRGMDFGMSDPGTAPTTGETFLFSGAGQPPEVTDAEPDVVTDEIVFARYVFLRDLEPIETNPADMNIVGLAEIQFYGFSLGDVNNDGSVNLFDVAPFVQLLSDGEYNVFADVNFDGVLNLFDVQPFVDLLAG